MEAPMSAARADELAARSETSSHRAPSDEVLIGEIAKKNQRALRALAERHHRLVHRFALRLVGDASHAEDVVSETFFAAWQHAAQFQNRSSVSTWLLGIARYRALAMRKRLRQTAEPLDDEIASNVPDPTSGPDEALERSNLALFLRECLHALPVEQARLIDLVYLREMPTQEAAWLVGIPVNTVKSRMFLARKKLAVLLSNADIETAHAKRAA
jgi:RNA polymerase sigma-70 factor (ECF subfamily)